MPRALLPALNADSARMGAAPPVRAATRRSSWSGAAGTPVHSPCAKGRACAYVRQCHSLETTADGKLLRGIGIFSMPPGITKQCQVIFTAKQPPSRPLAVCLNRIATGSMAMRSMSSRAGQSGSNDNSSRVPRYANHGNHDVGFVAQPTSPCGLCGVSRATRLTPRSESPGDLRLAGSAPTCQHGRTGMYLGILTRFRGTHGQEGLAERVGCAARVADEGG